MTIKRSRSFRAFTPLLNYVAMIGVTIFRFPSIAEWRMLEWKYYFWKWRLVDWRKNDFLTFELSWSAFNHWSTKKSNCQRIKTAFVYIKWDSNLYQNFQTSTALICLKNSSQCRCHKTQCLSKFKIFTFTRHTRFSLIKYLFSHSLSLADNVTQLINNLQTLRQAHNKMWRVNGSLSCSEINIHKLPRPFNSICFLHHPIHCFSLSFGTRPMLLNTLMLRNIVLLISDHFRTTTRSFTTSLSATIVCGSK